MKSNCTYINALRNALILYNALMYALLLTNTDDRMLVIDVPLLYYCYPASLVGKFTITLSQ
jgi:hypothetical protein